MSLPPRGWEIPKELHPTEEGATVGPNYLTIGASGGPGLLDHCQGAKPRGTPDRSKLFGSHGQRPGFHEVMNRYFDHGQHLHGSRGACRLHCRAWALLSNFTPWHKATARKNQGWRSPAERLNQHRYHDCWLQNLLISASCGGYRGPLPQNP